MLRITLLAALFAASLSPSLAQTPDGSDKTQALAYLIDSAAEDFNSSRIAKPLRVRDVRLGWVPTKSGDRQYQICGQFSPAGTAEEWADFATLKTSRYEQWIGATATGLCARDTITWEGDTGLTETLQDALR